MKTFAIAVAGMALVGCSPVVREKPPLDAIIGSWVMTKLDPGSASYLTQSGAPVDPAKKPAFEVRRDGSVSVHQIPLEVAASKAITVNASGNWRLMPPLSDAYGWTLLILLDEPKRGFHYEFHRDSRGLSLRGHFDPEDPGYIEFQRAP